MNATNYGKTLAAVVALGAAGALGGCVVRPASPPPPNPSYAIAAAPTNAPCKSCGTITAIQVENPNDYAVTMRMDNGTSRTVNLSKQPAFQVGDRVQILVRTSSY